MFLKCMLRDDRFSIMLLSISRCSVIVVGKRSDGRFRIE